MKNMLINGKLERVSDNVKPDYYIPAGTDLFSVSSALIPNISSISGNRVLLGDKSFTQAISLTNREKPLVVSAPSQTADSIVHTLGHDLAVVKSPVAGTVIATADDSITIKTVDGKKHELDFPKNFVVGKHNFIDHDPIVKVGDVVKKGQVVTKSNFTDDEGHLALGVNLNTAIMPWRSGNFEDAYVISQNAADKLKGTQIFTYRVDKKFGVETNKNKFISIFPNKFVRTQISKLDEDGVVKKGQRLSPDDPIILAYLPKPIKSTDLQLGKLSKVLKHAFLDQTETWDYDSEGEVVDVSKSGTMITVNVKSVRPMTVGSKLSLFSGSKGVVAEILPTHQTPTDEKGNPIDIILNSMSITSRVSPAVLNVMGAGKVAQKTGKQIKLTSFDKGSTVTQISELLKKHNVKLKENIYDPFTGNHTEVAVGPLNYSRLGHISEDKRTERGQGISYDLNEQPAKASVEESSKKASHQHTMALLAHGAREVINDNSLIRGQRNDDFWTKTKLGQTPAPLKVPFIFDKFINSLRGSGVNVDERQGEYTLIPMTDKHVDNISHGVIHSPNTFKLKKDKLIAEKDGLFDEVKTGIMGDRFNHIELNVKVPNPISEDPLRKLLNITKDQYNHLIATGEMEKKLAALNINDEIQKCKNYIKTGKVSDRNKSVFLLKFLLNLKKNNIEIKDLMLSKFPIIPAKYRPITLAGDLLLQSDVNALYKDLMLNNEATKHLEYLPDEESKQKIRLNQYNAVKAIAGFAEPINIKNQTKELKGLLRNILGIKGGSGKESMFQAKVINKPVDLVTRAVLVPDAKLSLDEARLPQDSIWKVYGAFVTKRLIQRGIPATQAHEYVQTRNAVAAQALLEELKDRPGIVTRDPQLHRWSTQGLYVRPNADPDDTTIKLNPLLYKAYGADNDGDQLNLHVPASDKAKDTIKQKMLPSQNVIASKDLKTPMFSPSNESALGLYQSSTEDKKNAVKTYKSEQDIIAAFNRGELDIGDNVVVG